MELKIRTKSCGLPVGVTTTEPPCGGCRAALYVSKNKVCDGVAMETTLCKRRFGLITGLLGN